jgi:hypothetical protein
MLLQEDAHHYQDVDGQREPEFADNGWHFLEEIRYFDSLESSCPGHLVSNHMANESA